MADLRDLYQETILDHSRSPKNFGELPAATHYAEGYNPLCGDRIKLYLVLDGDVVKDIRFQGVGCAISTASASLMTEALKGRTRAEAMALFRRLHEAVTGQSVEAAENGDGANAELGKLAVLEGVREYPLRIKCATLAWHALRNALLGKEDEVAVTE